MASWATYDVGPVCWEVDEYVAYQGKHRGDGGAVLIKVGKQRPADRPQFPDPIRRECELASELPDDRFGRCLASFEHDARSCAVFPWSGGKPVSELLAIAPPTVQDCLAIAGAAALLLDHLHAAHWVHGRLSPASLLWCEQTRQLRFSDLGAIVGARPTSAQAGRPLPLGLLTYAAPERVSLAEGTLDYRCDLYSLGAILYEMLTGRPPFVSGEAVALARAHRTTAPPAPETDRVSAPLWAILRLCLAKTPAARYASGGGLEFDLAHCREQLRGDGRCKPFGLRARDVPSRLSLSSKLYGRDAELAELTRCYREACDGGRRLALVRGAPGIGKTALVSALREQVATHGGTFVSGKYGQYHTDQPYVGITEALQALVSPVLSSSADELDAWRRRLEEELGENARVIGSVLPELGFPPPVAVSSKESRHRFLSTFVAFLRYCIGDAPPLVLFLDDLQWMDSASQELLSELLTAPGIDRLLVVGAYRDDEVGESSALSRLLEQDGPGIVAVALRPLTDENVEHYLADSLCCEASRVRVLARTVREKTRSDPLFMVRFIEGLYAAGRIRYEPDARQWTWDEAAIASVSITDNVVGFMVDKLRGYRPEEVEALSNIACLGGGVSVARLSLLLGAPEEEVHRRLQPALADGVLVRDNGAAHIQRRSTALAAATGAPTTALAPVPEETEVRFRFSHDKLEQAAYELLDDDACERLHLDIGRHLLAHDQAHGDDIFLVTKQYDHWLDRHALPAEDDAVPGLYFEAGQRARTGNAYESARQCFQSADTLLDDASWDTDYPLMIALHRDWAETEYLLGNRERSRSLINKALQYCRSNEDEARLIVMLIDQHTANAEYQEAIILGRNALGDLGFEGVMGRPFPKRSIEKVLAEELDVTARYQVDAFEDKLMQVGEPEDENLRAMMTVLMSLIPPSYFIDRKLNALVATFMARLTYEKEFVCESTAKGISNFGNALAEERGMYREGYLYARLALRFAQERYEAVVPRILYSLAGSLNHWVQHLASSEEDIEAGIRLCEKYGERDYNGYLRTLARCQNGIFLGAPLARFKLAVRESIGFVERARNALGLQIAKSVYQAICELDGSAPGELVTDTQAADAKGDNQAAAAPEDADTRLIRCIANVLRVQNAWFLGHLDDARRALDEALSLAESLSTEMTLPMLNLYSSLVVLDEIAAAGGAAGAPEQIAQVRENQLRMRDWAAGCPANFQHAYLLVEGSLAAVEGRSFDAIKAYRSAAECAAVNGYRQFEGLAHELLARRWRVEEQERYARDHVVAAAAAYESWGARRVVERLLREHPPVARAQSGSANGVAADKPSAAAVGDTHRYRDALAPAVQALTGRGHHASLQTAAAQQVAVLAGAQQCLLFVCAGAQLRLAASFPALEQEYEDLDDVLQRLVTRASRTGEVEGHGGPGDSPTPTPAPASHLAASIAVPVNSGNGVIAIAYLENSIGELDLSDERLGLLRVLTLVAVSAEYARLHDEAARPLGKLSRFLPAHVREAVLARGDERLAAITREEAGIAFFDLRHFTAFHSSVEPEEGRRLLEQYRRAMGEISAAYGATTDHWEGDGCMVFIASPVPPDERIARLVDMALAMRRRARTLIKTWSAHGYELGFGIGAAYGFADCGILGTEQRWDYSATGRYVSLASRLCDAAKDGQILVTDPIHAALGAQQPMELIGENDVDGFANSIRIFNVLG